MKKLLISSILLMVLVGNTFAAEVVHHSRGQRIYVPISHSVGPILGTLEFQFFTTRISVRNFDGDAMIEYIEYHGVNPDTGDLLPPVKLDLIPPLPVDEAFDLPPWSNWVWVTPQLLGGPPTTTYTTAVRPFFIIKWVSTNGNRIAAPLILCTVSIQEGNNFSTSRLKAIFPIEVVILEELWSWW
jgi:hypothetical protein